MTPSACFARAGFALIAVCLAAGPTAAQFQDLAAKVPAHANALTLVNVKAVMASPVAVKGNWKAEHENSYAAGITFLPPHADTAVLAAQYDFEMMVPLWQVAVMELERDVSWPTAQRLTGGTMDKLGEYTSMALPGDAYLVQFAPRVLAAMAPANRQMVGRWVRETEGATGPQLSPYLMEAYTFANDLGTPIILAMDLQDVATPDAIQQMLEESGKYSDAKTIEQRVALLSSIRGVTLGITLQGDAPFGKVKVDFGNPVDISPDEAKAMLLHALARRGAMLDELDDWTPKVAGKQVTLEGALTRSGMKRLTSLFDRPPAFKEGAVSAAPATTTPDQTQPNVQASQEYFRRVTDLLEDLRLKPKQQTGGRTLGQNAVWCDQFARKIDKLPILGVDPELVDYGASAAQSLRQASEAIKMIGARTRTRQANIQPQYDYYTYGTTYGYSYRSNYYGSGYVPYGTSTTVAVPDTQAYAHERARITTEERASGATDARAIFDHLEKATADIRRKMTTKYNAEF